VDSLGPGAARFGIGDRIGIAWLRSTCGHCRFCAGHRENSARTRPTRLDPRWRLRRVCLRPGSLRLCHSTPFDDAEATPLLCAGIIGYRALSGAGCPEAAASGSTASLFGHITLQVARHWGCAVYVATREPVRRRLALDLGAVWAGAPGDPLPIKLDAAIVFAPVGALVPIACAISTRAARRRSPAST